MPFGAELSISDWCKSGTSGRTVTESARRAVSKRPHQLKARPMAVNAELFVDDAEWRGRLDIGRLARLKAQLRAFDCAAGLYYDPINIRYATGTSNMQVYALHNPCRYVFVATEGAVILFEFKGCEHL